MLKLKIRCLAGEGRGRQTVPVDEVGPCEGLPAVAHGTRHGHFGIFHNDGLSFYACRGGVEQAVAACHFKACQFFGSAGRLQTVGMAEGQAEGFALAHSSCVFGA